MEELNLDPLENALRQLEDGLEKAQMDLTDELHWDGVIQRFKYSMDLAWKSIQRYLRVIAQIDEVAGTARDSKCLSLAILADLWDAFSLSNIPYKVDVIDWAAISPNFQKVIMKDCFEIQLASQE
jgi:hypothetical protein